MVHRKAPIKFSSSELNALLEDPVSQVFLKKGKRHLALHPSSLGDVNKAIKENLNSVVAQFDPELNGILLGVTKVKILSKEGTIINDACHVHLDIKARFYVFKPEVGCQLIGVVKKLSSDNIGCLVHNVFNVAIPRRDSAEEEENLELGNKVTFTVEYLDFSGSLPYIRGKLIPVSDIPHGGTYSKREKESSEDEFLQGQIEQKKQKKDIKQEKGLLWGLPQDLKEIISLVEKKIKKEVEDPSTKSDGKIFERKPQSPVEVKSRGSVKEPSESFAEAKVSSDSKVSSTERLIKEDMSENVPVSYELTKKKRKRKRDDNKNSIETQTWMEEPLGKKKKQHHINGEDERNSNEGNYSEGNDLCSRVAKLSDQEISPKKKKKKKHQDKTLDTHLGMEVKREERGTKEKGEFLGILPYDVEAFVSERKMKKKKDNAKNTSEGTNPDVTLSTVKVVSKKSEKQGTYSESDGNPSKKKDKKRNKNIDRSQSHNITGSGEISVNREEIIDGGATNTSNDDAKEQKTCRRAVTKELNERQESMDERLPSNKSESDLESVPMHKHTSKKRKHKHEHIISQGNSDILNQTGQNGEQTIINIDTKEGKKKIKKASKDSPKSPVVPLKDDSQKSSLRILQSIELLSPIKRPGTLDASGGDNDHSFATSTQIATSSPYNTLNTKPCSDDKDVSLRRALHKKKADIPKLNMLYASEDSKKIRMDITSDSSTSKHSSPQSKLKMNISSPYSDSDSESDVGEGISLPTQQRTGSFSEHISKHSKQKKGSNTESKEHTVRPSNPNPIDGSVETNPETSFQIQATKSKHKRKDLALSTSEKLTALQQETEQLYFKQSSKRSLSSEHDLSGEKSQEDVVGKASSKRKKIDLPGIEKQELASNNDKLASENYLKKAEEKQELGLSSSKYFGFNSQPAITKSKKVKEIPKELLANAKSQENSLKVISSPKKKSSDQPIPAVSSAHPVGNTGDSDSSSSTATNVARKTSALKAKVAQKETSQFSPIFSKTHAQSEDSDDNSGSEYLAKHTVANKQSGVPVRKAIPAKQKSSALGGTESDASSSNGSKRERELASPKSNIVPLKPLQIKGQGANNDSSDSDDSNFPLTQKEKSPEKGRSIGASASKNNSQKEIGNNAGNNGLGSSKYFGFNSQPAVTKPKKVKEIPKELLTNPKSKGNSPKKKSSDQLIPAVSSAHPVDKMGDSDSSSSTATNVAKKTIMEKQFCKLEKRTIKMSPIPSQKENEDTASDDSLNFPLTQKYSSPVKSTQSENTKCREDTDLHRLDFDPSSKTGSSVHSVISTTRKPHSPTKSTEGTRSAERNKVLQGEVTQSRKGSPNKAKTSTKGKARPKKEDTTDLEQLRNDILAKTLADLKDI